MQIDFHHGVTYIVGRLAGFDHEEANIVAYCAQYVDDSTNSGLLRFDNGAIFNRISSAHKLLDYRNFKQLANYGVWIPFHFLPGNGGLPAGQDPEGKFINKLICRPNSYVAQDMLTECINRRDTAYGLHRLGISMHVYADTWAHQGFAGVNHRVNEAKLLLDQQGYIDQDLTNRVEKFFNKNLLDRLANAFLSEAFPLGHGAVLSNPDKPFLKWGYTNGLDQRIERDNPKDFLEAADNMCQWMQRYRVGDAHADVPGLPSDDKTLIVEMIQNITNKDAEVRHKKWLESIEKGKFSFGESQVNYLAKGKGSWKYEALGTEKDRDSDNELFSYNPNFLTSNWKMFHDALETHRLYVTHELLPRYGICVA
ncbi:MAG: hypothetical protein F6K10_02170 [Moorea sp. SIO2B7]|nr:hypothetical protein [Moorena sp. SIO2B7]